jgi:nucleoside-diphosphate-sugar epimerase
MKQDIIVVAGAGGFIGGHLVNYLQKTGFSKIRALDMKPLKDWYQQFADVENLQVDLSEKEACQKALAGASQVYNLAANMGGIGFIEGNKAMCMLSVLINSHMLMAARDANIERFFFSSGCVVSAQDKTMTSILRACVSRAIGYAGRWRTDGKTFQ